MTAWLAWMTFMFLLLVLGGHPTPRMFKNAARSGLPPEPGG